MDVDDGAEISLDTPDSGAPTTPLPPPTSRGGGEPSGQPMRIARFAPWFGAIALIVGIERTSMVLVVAESLPLWVRLAGLTTFFAMVVLVMSVGGWLFARNFRR